MKALFLDCEKFKASKSENNSEETCDDCLVVLITFEKNDDIKKAEKLNSQIAKIARDLNKSKIVLGPFAHLSHKILEPQKAYNLLFWCQSHLTTQLDVTVSEFGVEKGLLLDVKAGPKNIRFRSF